MKLRLLLVCCVIALSFFIGDDLLAQCPMCKMSAESNLANGGTEGRGLNKGILYMLSLPYLMVGFIGLMWYRNRKATKDSSEDSI